MNKSERKWSKSGEKLDFSGEMLKFKRTLGYFLALGLLLIRQLFRVVLAGGLALIETVKVYFVMGLAVIHRKCALFVQKMLTTCAKLRNLIGYKWASPIVVAKQKISLLTKKLLTR